MQDPIDIHNHDAPDAASEKLWLIRIAPCTAMLLVILFLIQTMSVIAPEMHQKLKLLFGFYPGGHPLTAGQPAWGYVTPLSYGFFHASWLHFFVNGGMLIAMGSGCEKRYGKIGFGVLWIGGSLGGVVAQLLAAPISQPGIFIIGASASITAMLGALADRLNPAKPFHAVLLLTAIMILSGQMAIQGASIAWPAHLGGLFAGYMLSCFLTRKTSQN